MPAPAEQQGFNERTPADDVKWSPELSEEAETRAAEQSLKLSPLLQSFAVAGVPKVDKVGEVGEARKAQQSLAQDKQESRAQRLARDVSRKHSSDKSQKRPRTESANKGDENQPLPLSSKAAPKTKAPRPVGQVNGGNHGKLSARVAPRQLPAWRMPDRVDLSPEVAGSKAKSPAPTATNGTQNAGADQVNVAFAPRLNPMLIPIV